MTLSLFHLPPTIYGFLPALAAAALAVIGYLAARRLVASLGRSSVSRLETFAGESGNPRAAGVPVGVATCWEALTGTVVWSERLGGHYSASPLAAGRHIYLFSEEGSTTVISAGRRFGTTCVSMMGDGYMASPAVSGKALFLRSRTQLYRIEK